MTVFFIDPMSYNNPARYDKCLIENTDAGFYFFASGNIQFDDIKNAIIIKNYFYHDKRHIIKLFSYLYSEVKVIWRFAKVKPDIVHIQWVKIPSLDVLFCALVKMIHKNCKLIYTAHNVLPHSRKTGDRFFYGILYQLFDGIIVHVQTSKEAIKSLFNIPDAKIRVIPHGLI